MKPSIHQQLLNTSPDNSQHRLLSICVFEFFGLFSLETFLLFGDIFAFLGHLTEVTFIVFQFFRRTHCRNSWNPQSQHSILDQSWLGICRCKLWWQYRFDYFFSLFPSFRFTPSFPLNLPLIPHNIRNMFILVAVSMRQRILNKKSHCGFHLLIIQMPRSFMLTQKIQ